MFDSREPIARFSELYGREPELLVEAPGRINLIGGSTDYNQGYVLPVAIDLRTLLLSRRRDDDVVRIYSTSLASSGELKVTEGEKQEGWLRYPGGILNYLSEEKICAPGMDLLIDGNLPVASGLASSAALEVGFLSTIIQLGALDMSSEEIITICHRVENDFVGMKCGIMDQFASAMGRKEKAIFLDCRDMSHRYIDFDDDTVSLLLFDSGVRRELAESEYNSRQKECFDALREIQIDRPDVNSLRDLLPCDLAWLEETLEPEKFQRCRHVITEISRVESAGKALESGDSRGLGELVKASHVSLRDDFEVSCEELDHLFTVSNEQEGVYGSRLTGAGFGGILLVLCQPPKVGDVTREVAASFRDRFGRDTEATVCGSSDGVDARWL